MTVTIFKRKPDLNFNYAIQTLTYSTMFLARKQEYINVTIFILRTPEEARGDIKFFHQLQENAKIKMECTFHYVNFFNQQNLRSYASVESKHVCQALYAFLNIVCG